MEAINLLRHSKWVLPDMPVHAQSYAGFASTSSQE